MECVDGWPYANHQLGTVTGSTRNCPCRWKICRISLRTFVTSKWHALYRMWVQIFVLFSSSYSMFGGPYNVTLLLSFCVESARLILSHAVFIRSKYDWLYFYLSERLLSYYSTAIHSVSAGISPALCLSLSPSFSLSVCLCVCLFDFRSEKCAAFKNIENMQVDISGQLVNCRMLFGTVMVFQKGEVPSIEK